jgi:hypothetical protein
MSFNILAKAWSIGAIDFNGCTTNARLYNMKATMPAKISVTTITTKPQIRVSNSSAVR